ncbi:MAG: tRNA (guanosine(37)-N1)-methyltransferase TrmD [Acidobacteriota bacterium]|nr:tRNA (guanosine(37)-N1)-methyltransferase TrmD [Acidobacteriota bacterium]
MHFDIVTIFPGFFASPLEYGILRRAIATGQVQVQAHDLRAFTTDRHRTVDDRPFGGGEGMVLKPEPIFRAVESLGVTPKAERDTTRESVILLSAQGRPFTQQVAQRLATLQRIVILCGRYEGVDERVNEALCDQELSIGDYVLSGGELAAAVLIDATVRLLPGALGNPDSARFESFGAADRGQAEDAEAGVPRTTHGSGGLLDYPHYTRPAEFAGLAIPEPLHGGNHDEIRRWRRRMSLQKTMRNRPDLLATAQLTAEDLRTLAELRREQDRPVHDADA